MIKHACRQATKIASDGLDRRLSAWEILRLKLHLLLCGNCRNFDRSIHILHQAVLMIRRAQYDGLQLSPEQRQRLSSALKQEVNF